MEETALRPGTGSLDGRDVGELITVCGGDEVSARDGTRLAADRTRDCNGQASAGSGSGSGADSDADTGADARAIARDANAFARSSGPTPFQFTIALLGRFNVSKPILYPSHGASGKHQER